MKSTLANGKFWFSLPWQFATVKKRIDSRYIEMQRNHFEHFIFRFSVGRWMKQFSLILKSIVRIYDNFRSMHKWGKILLFIYLQQRDPVEMEINSGEQITRM